MFNKPRNNINLIIPSPSIQLNSSVPFARLTEHYFISSVSIILPFFPTTSPFGFFSIPYSQENLSMEIITEKISGPIANGSLWLSSSIDGKAKPNVQFNYFADPKDLSRCVSAMRKISEMLNTTALEQFIVEDSNGTRSSLFYGPSLPMNQFDDPSMESFCRSTVLTIYHDHGRCLVDKVVDGEFRVTGISGLCVVDGSTFITSSGTNPQATVMMLGR